MERRAFFKQLVGRGTWEQNRLSVVRKFRLTDFAMLPDDVLGDLSPTLAPGVSLVTRDGQVSAERHAQELAVYAAHDPRSTVVARFDGRLTLNRIADDLAASNGLTREQAFVLVRDVFLELVVLDVTVPAQAMLERRRVFRSLHG